MHLCRADAKRLRIRVEHRARLFRITDALNGARTRRPSLLHHGLRRIAETDRHAVIHVHQANGDRQVHKFSLIEHGAGGFIRHVGHAGLRHQRDGFRPREVTMCSL